MPTWLRTRSFHMRFGPAGIVSKKTEKLGECLKTPGDKLTGQLRPQLWTTTGVQKSNEQICWETDTQRHNAKELETTIRRHVGHAENWCNACQQGRTVRLDIHLHT